ncbi:MAG: 4-alpha-glucanotransferase [Anaerolineae bacterium]|nr:4-alpha-glucanotransferase [Anaerolineae bacterium]
MRFPRSAGILLHPTSLPGGYGIGELGEQAYRFIDFLVESGQSLWQVLPLGPTGYADSPYACFSAFAGNPLLINLNWLASEGDIDPQDLEQAPHFPNEYVDYGPVINFKMAILHRAARKFRAEATSERREKFEAFCEENSAWLDDYILFMALKEAHGGAVWNTWEWELAARDPETLAAWHERLDENIFAHRYLQYQFFRQWDELKKYANDKGVQIVGDIPIFVAYDSADVWAHPELFHLDDDYLPTIVAGVPPDYFSPTGQLWGNPLYCWDKMAEGNYEWWIARLSQCLQMVDIVRLDHFRGFAAYWEIPAGEPTAVNGKWKEGPGAPLFTAIRDALGELPIIAEDLGHITEDVEELRDQFKFPGMKILQFAFTTDATNPYLPHNCEPNCVIYTGTHDNDTTLGWFESREEEEKLKAWRYLGPISESINWALIRMAYRSVVDIAIAPLQDVLGLGNSARMNTPGNASGNWSWRFTENMLREEISSKLMEMALTYGRKEPEEPESRPSWM